METQHFYEVDLTWQKDRIGELSSPTLNDKITCATPPEFPKGIAGIWSPEHLYTAAINSCFMTTFLAIAENSQLDFETFDCKTTATLEKVDGKFIISKAIIQPKVKLVRPDNDNDKLIRVLEKSKKACLISNSMLTEVTLKHDLILSASEK